MKRPAHWPIACAQAGLLMMAMLLFLPWLDLAEAADVVNPGPTTLSNVRMIDTLPAGVSYNSFAKTRGGSCAATTAHTITCDLASLDATRVWTIYLYTTVDPATLGAISNQASASANGLEPDLANNSGEESTLVDAAPAQLDQLISLSLMLR
ncbi:MAG: hypothetical protein ABIV47_13185 [Roseiflexaceae bacterium]